MVLELAEPMCVSEEQQGPAWALVIADDHARRIAAVPRGLSAAGRKDSVVCVGHSLMIVVDCKLKKNVAIQLIIEYVQHK